MMLPDGTPRPLAQPATASAMRLAAAAPEIPWTDLAYSLMPNGRTLDYVADAPLRRPRRRAEELVRRRALRDRAAARRTTRRPAPTRTRT